MTLWKITLVLFFIAGMVAGVSLFLLLCFAQIYFFRGYNVEII